MRVLVTGSAGFIGGYVAAELERRGHEMVPFDRPRDVRDRSAVFAATQDVEAIINLAGMLGTAEILGSERAATEVNILGAVHAFDVAAKLKIPVVQIGTGHKGQPNPYAVTKACAEDLGLARAQWQGERIAVVRAFHVYGPGQKPPPPHGQSPVRKIVPSFVCRALTGMPIEIWGSGRQRIDLVHAGDVARVLVDAIGGPYGQVTEAGTGKPTTVNGAAEEIAGETGGPVMIRRLPMRPGEPEDSTVVAAAPACVNPWPYKLAETVDWYREWLSRSSR